MKLDECCKKKARMPKELPMASKVRVATTVIRSFSIVSEKSIEVRKCIEKWMASVMALDPIEQKNSC